MSQDEVTTSNVVVGKGPVTALGIILGAAEYPELPKLASPHLAGAFRLSRDILRRHMLSMCGEVLDLFDDGALPAHILLRVADFIVAHPQATDLVVYYVGHGGFLRSQDYFVACRSSSEKPGQKHLTVLRMTDLAATILDTADKCRAYLLLDCCFAGSAVPAFQAAEADALKQQLDRLPLGVAVLAATSRHDVAEVPDGSTSTLFARGVDHVLKNGMPDVREGELTLRELGRGVARHLQNFRSMPAMPEVHSPHQNAGDPAEYRFFENVAVQLEPRTAEARPHASGPQWEPPVGFSLRFTSGEKAGEGFAVAETEETTIGRSAGCTVEVQGDDKMSRTHARFRSDGNAILVEDLKSVNGVLVNGIPVQAAILAAGDCVQIGSTTLVVLHRHA